MKRFFNTAGACQPDIHYTVWRTTGISPILELIEQRKYFTHHAPRQSGKTTLLRELCRKLNSEGKYLALHITVESAQASRHDVMDANRIILTALENLREDWDNAGDFPPALGFSHDRAGVQACLTQWCKASKRPLVFVIDEIDSMGGESLIALLRQLRAGYDHRPRAYPQSIILNGVRDLKDYRIYSKEEDIWLTGGSCFNVKAESVRLGNFTLDNVKELFHQHETERGQSLALGLVDAIYELTQGQPWLCNALGEQMCHKLFPSEPVLDMRHLQAAKEALIQSRTTHIDQLYYRLEDPRIRQIVFPMLRGDDAFDFPAADIEYARDLGLLHPESKTIQIANPLYKEILPREMTYVLQQTMVEEPKWYENADGTLDYQKLMDHFVQFWREHGHKEFYDREVSAHVLFMAWLQRLVNGGGTIHREYALGRKRLDILVEFAGERFVSEIKLYRNDKTLEDGLNQICDYLGQIGLNEGYLMIFKDTKATDDNARYRCETREHQGKTVFVYWL